MTKAWRPCSSGSGKTKAEEAEEKRARWADEQMLLGDVLGKTPDQIKKAMFSGQETFVRLNEKPPVSITYFTAWVDQGLPNFRNDIYGQDAKLIAALDGQALAW